MSDINIFISWSGEDTLSHEVAKLLRDYLPKLHDRWNPFLSSHDLVTGVSWIRGLFDNLQKSHFGVLCLTQEALRDRRWVYFEAGAIAMRLEPTRQESARVVPLLIDLDPDQLPAPLSLFQACSCDEDGLERLVHSLSEVGSFSSDTTKIVVDRLKMYWPLFNESVSNAQRRAKRKDGKELPRRTTDDYLKEILDVCKRSSGTLDLMAQSQSQAPALQSSPVQVVISQPASLPAPVPGTFSQDSSEQSEGKANASVAADG